MPSRFLCDQCRSLSARAQPLPAHSGLRPMLELEGGWLYRCRHCGAFATAPADSRSGWSLNVHGQAVPPGSMD
ncbi:hypothetical protein GCM10011352_13740 [Marinobacterium zhoushanense]|uniref:Uncharacterized protein n=1 Tax=Marinobacterium zhoushanense TaxID=1679163 RepID=A0ABQ1K7C5_9GAMM|nr:hypothetical protein [Marinobacterium zhoushanense]GGB88978.1 hypothetical protein GCM10011352_13740 [Marinobacterium zhoushanense]